MPTRVAVIGGSALTEVGFLRDVTVRPISTPYGSPSSDVVAGRSGGTEVAFLARHGRGRTIPPHRINHRANLWALKEIGVRHVLGVSSVGSLKKSLAPGGLAVPHDYLSLWGIPTFYDDKVVHVTPTLDEGVRSVVLATAKGRGVRARGKAVYAQTRGPRLETKAEIRLLARYADLVGMTLASEATLAAELGVAYAGLCTVDNYAHGIGTEPLTYDDIAKAQRRNAQTVAALLGPVVESLDRGANV